MPHSILVLDDDVHVRESLVISLEDEDFNVYEADSSEKALEFLDGTRVDLVIVDLRLPGMNGTEFIHSASSKWSELNFIIYTGSPEFSLPLDLSFSPKVCNSVFLKPLPSIDLLMKEIRIMLA